MSVRSVERGVAAGWAWTTMLVVPRPAIPLRDHRRTAARHASPTTVAATLAMLAAVTAAGCVREVVSGEDPQARRGRLTGKSGRDSLVVNIPWMEIPAPRLLFDGKLVVHETVAAPLDLNATRFTLRATNDATATVRATRRAEGRAIEFTYTVEDLPPRYALDTIFDLDPDGIKPAIDVAVNGAAVKVNPGTDLIFVQLARDSATRVLATPRAVPAADVPPAPATDGLAPTQNTKEAP